MMSFVATTTQKNNGKRVFFIWKFKENILYL